MRDRVNEGASLGDAMAATGAFSGLYVSMVRAGEAGGALETVLERLADYLESQVRLRNKVSSILIYPLVMLGFAGFVVGVSLGWVDPGNQAGRCGTACACARPCWGGRSA